MTTIGTKRWGFQFTGTAFSPDSTDPTAAIADAGKLANADLKYQVSSAYDIVLKVAL
jgi:hypothetical protein